MGLVILGIDPGTVATGYGLIKISDKGLSCLDYGTLSSREKSFSLRVQTMHKDIEELCEIHQPDHLAIEKIFFGKNPDTAFKLGHIFAICLLISQWREIEFFEYASRFVKKSVTFSGNASTDMLARFVRNYFSLPGPKSHNPSPHNQKIPLDATDALAVALCHSRQLKNLESQKQGFQKGFQKRILR